MPDVTVSALHPAELPRVLELLKQAKLPELGIAENVQGFAVARLADAVVGCVGVEVYGSSGLLRSVAVKPSHAGRGVGALLVNHALLHATRQNLVSLYLLTTTARGYFSRFEFADCLREQAPEAIRSSWEFRSGCPASATLMIRRL